MPGRSQNGCLAGRVSEIALIIIFIITKVLITMTLSMSCAVDHQITALGMLFPCPRYAYYSTMYLI